VHGTGDGQEFLVVRVVGISRHLLEGGQFAS
jgi:hypothetical protein